MSARNLWLAIVVLLMGCEISCYEPIVEPQITNQTVDKEQGKIQEKDQKFEELPLVEVVYFEEITGNVVFKTRVISYYSGSDLYVYTDIGKLEIVLRKDSQNHTSLRMYDRASEGAYGIYYFRNQESGAMKVYADYCGTIQIAVPVEEDVQTWKDWLSKLKQKREAYLRKVDEEFNRYKKRILPPK